MAMRMKIPQAAEMRRSVEVKHSVKGLRKMLRRGLHGSKNWVLELDENGEHRSAWSKLFRVAVILLPVWIVMSAMTGGPERGGRQVSAFQSVVGALLVLLVGLAAFSARERRLGREEPWQDFAEDEDPATEGDESAAETKVLPAPEGDAETSEEPQVTDSDSTENGENPENDSEISTEITQIEQPDLHAMSHEATSPDPETVAIPTPEAPTVVLPQAVRQATGEVTNEGKPDQSFDEIASVVDDFRNQDLRQAIPEPPYSLVKEPVEAVQQEVQQADPGWTNLDVPGSTESDDGSIEDQPTTPLRAAVRSELHEKGGATESPQVNLLKKAVQQPLQGVLQVEFASPGPYPQGDEPVHEGWWIVAPDVEPEEGPGEPSGDIEGGGSPLPSALPAEEGQEAPQAEASRYPMAVLTYHASQSPRSNFTTEEKDEARSSAIAWLRGEVESGLTRAEGARILGVDGSTVTRWLNDDPWAG